MDLEELRAFLTVVDTGSFLAAADSLGVSRTTLRRRVGALEARAGVPLLESTRQGAVLTDAGSLMARQGRIMVQEASALFASLREVGQEPAGILRVVLPVGLPPHLLTPLFGALRATYPKLSVQTRVSDDPLGEALVDVDMVVHFGDAAPRGAWLSHTIVRVRQWLLATRSYLELRGAPQSIEDLQNHELFAWQAPGEDARRWPTLDGRSFVVQPSLVSTDIHFVRHCCVAGTGIAFVPDALLPDREAEPLVPVLPEIVGRELSLRVTVPEALCDLPKVRMVLAHTRSFLGSL